ncbi:MAG: hypothetical protein FJ098_08810, partial [Deltaproteobacteria bacterium]|nr:hypothetical protein [Deltaproteobacteria bacterium]
ELTADEPTGEHGPCGFEVPWPEALKDGEAHVVKVLAHGGEGLAPGTLPGSGRWVLCGSGTAQKGIWTLAWEEAGGLGIDLNPTFEDGSSLALVHPGDKPYPVSGRVTATTVLGPDPVDEVRFQAEGTLDPAVYEVSLGSGGETQGLEDDGEHSWVPAGQPGAVTVTFASLASVVDPAHRVLQLTGLAARTGPWWNTYSWDAAGFTWSHGDTDRVAFELRAGAAPATRGDADCWHLFGEAFDGVSFEVDQDLVAGLAVQVLVDGTLALHLGPSFLLPEVDLEAPGEELRFRFVSQPDLAVPPGAGVRLSRVRVHKSRTEALYPWQVTWDRAWALSPALPDLPHHGLAVRLSTEDAGGWFSSGTLEARTQVAEGACGEGCRPEEPDSREPEHDVPAFDRVRGLLSAGISAPYVARLQVNDEVVREITAALPVSEPFDLEKDGWFFGVSLAVDPASLGTTPGWVELSGVSFHRGGWWSTADNDTRGLADTRLEDCGVRLQAQPGWAEAGLEASGQLLVHRELATAVSGVRFRRSGGDGTQGLVLSLMADGQDVLNLASPEGEALESWRGQVRSVGFRVTVSQPAVFPTPWVVDLSDVEVEVAGAWQSICSRPESEDWQVICSGEACGGDPGDDPGDDPEGAGGETSGSCARAPVSGSLSPWLLLAALGLFLRRRRMAS